MANRLAADRPRLVIAGSHSGVGKTTVALGLMAALRKRGRIVQAYKVGPDYIDPGYHALVTGRPSRNLDSWMLPPEALREIFHHGSADADLSIIEGMMGLFDGKEARSNRASTAEVSQWLECPVVLVVDAVGMARSIAAVVSGFQRFEPGLHLAGVIANRVGGPGHEQILKEALEDTCGVPLLGSLTASPALEMPERHLGLVPALEQGDLAQFVERVGRAVEETVDLEAVESIARAAAKLPLSPPCLYASRPIGHHPVIAVAMDEAFNFYYRENLELLETYGATLATFRPLHGEAIPEAASALYIGGGFPEEHALRLSTQSKVIENFKQRIEQGLPTFAECGGLIFLTRSVTDRHDHTYPMVGVIPASIRMRNQPSEIGYRDLEAVSDCLLLEKGERIKGHAFHYSYAIYDPSRNLATSAYRCLTDEGSRPDGYRTASLVAGYSHLHFASNPDAARRFVAAADGYHRDLPHDLQYRSRTGKLSFGAHGRSG